MLKLDALLPARQVAFDSPQRRCRSRVSLVFVLSRHVFGKDMPRFFKGDARQRNEWTQQHCLSEMINRHFLELGSILNTISENTDDAYSRQIFRNLYNNINI